MTSDDVLSESTSAESRPVPIGYAGQWIAWNPEGTRIVANGRTLQEAAQAAAAAGESQPVFAKVPKADVRFAGLRG
jgi:hypothetical protein